MTFTSDHVRMGVSVCVVALSIVCVGCNQRPAQPEQPYGCDEGRRYMEKGENDQAILAFDRVLQENSKNAQAHFFRAQACQNSKKIDECLTGYSAAIELDGEIAEAFRNGNGESYAGAVSLGTHLPTAHFQRGTLYAQQKMVDAAIADYGRAILLSSDYADAWRVRGALFLEKGMLDLACDDLTHAIAIYSQRIDPRNERSISNYVSALCMRGEAWVKSNRPDPAADDGRRAVQLNSQCAKAYQVLGSALAMKKEFPEALVCYETASQLDKSLVTSGTAKLAALYVNWAAELSFQYPAKAEEKMNMASQYDPTHPAVVEYLRKRADQTADQQRAFENLRAAQVHIGRGRECLAAQNPRQAIGDFTQAIRLVPKCADGYFERGLAFLEGGFTETAIADLKQAAWLSSKDPNIYCALARAYAIGGKPHLAVEEATTAIRLDPACAAAYEHRGKAYAKISLLDLAVRDFDEAVALNPRLKSSLAPALHAVIEKLAKTKPAHGGEVPSAKR